MNATARLVSLSLSVGAWACTSPPAPPSLYDDAALAMQVDTHDGFDGPSPRFSGFVDGAPVHYWTLAGGTPIAMRVYRLCSPVGDDPCHPLDHPPIVDALPGEAGYSAYGQVYWVHVPSGWSGQLASVEEVDAEIASLGLAAPTRSSMMTHCPIAMPDAEIEVDVDATVTPEGTVYVRGFAARCFEFTANRRINLLPDGTVFIRNVYMVTREGESAPLSEAARMTDLTGDGDQRDSNNIFGVALGDGFYTPWWQLVFVTVPATVSSIDRSMDETIADYRSAHDMFEVAPDYTITPRPGQIVDYELTDTFINCPLQSATGVL